MRMYNGYAMTVRMRQKLSQARQRREARIFLAGFWTGLTLGMIVAVACVIVALWLRG